MNTCGKAQNDPKEGLIALPVEPVACCDDMSKELMVCRVALVLKSFPACVQILRRRLAVGNGSTMTLSSEQRSSQEQGNTKTSNPPVGSRLCPRRNLCRCTPLVHLIGTKRGRSTCPVNMRRVRREISRLDLQPPNRCAGQLVGSASLPNEMCHIEALNLARPNIIDTCAILDDPLT